jgi:tRNA pseudouridine55 synthase
MRKGQDVTLAAREINILALKVCHYEKDSCTFVVKCSKGTYVRSLAQDIAHSLGTCGFVSALRRIESGPFTLDHALSLEDIAKTHEKGLLKEYVSSIHGVLDDIPALVLSREHLKRLRLGQRLLEKDIIPNSGLSGFVSLLDDQNTLWGLGLIENQVLHPKRMFVYEPN